jgi:hypothetical protein
MKNVIPALSSLLSAHSALVPCTRVIPALNSSLFLAQSTNSMPALNISLFLASSSTHIIPVLHVDICIRVQVTSCGLRSCECPKSRDDENEDTENPNTTNPTTMTWKFWQESLVKAINKEFLHKS